jgi:hypothetical protein
VTARTKDKTEQDEKTAGTDQSKTEETTKQAEEKAAQTPTSVEPRGETDAEAAASGSSVGAVVDGDSGLEDEAVEQFEDGEIGDGVVGTVTEVDSEGAEYDAPYAFLTPELGLTAPRTSDSDDPAKDWTAQHAGGEREDADGNSDPVALVPVQGTPGGTFRIRELPNREVVEAAGIDYDQWVAGLPVRADVPNEAARRGIPA